MQELVEYVTRNQDYDSPRFVEGLRTHGLPLVEGVLASIKEGRPICGTAHSDRIAGDLFSFYGQETPMMDFIDNRLADIEVALTPAQYRKRYHEITSAQKRAVNKHLRTELDLLRE